MLKRISALILALSLCFCLTLAQAVTYPEKRGAVNDDAAVLSDGTAQDIDTLNSRSDVRFTVVTRHFLGGLDAQEYCNGLFDAWKLGKEDILLLLVIGEERYAATLGSSVAGHYISSEQLNSLFSSKLRQPFIQDRDYDGAVGAFLLAAATQVARAEGKTLNTAGLFGTAQGTASSGSGSSTWSNIGSWTSDLWSSFFSDDELNVPAGQSSGAQYEYDGDSGFSVGRLVLIVAVILFAMRSRRKQGKSGLGLLGWGAVGLGAREFMKGMGGHHGRPRR